MTRDLAPLIGITADLSEEGTRRAKSSKEPFLFIAERYLRAIEQMGAVPIVLPAARSPSAVRRLLELLNGLVVSGGNFDIHPRHYRERPIAGLGTVKPTRTAFELAITDTALKCDLPVLGICGGAQAINVVLGGSLYQDISSQIADARVHESGGKARTHLVRLDPRSRLFEIFGRRSLRVNTSHHQAVKKLGRGLRVSAIADDGVIEALESNSHRFVIGVQWHPEALMARQKLQRRLFVAFVKACREHKGQRAGGRGQLAAGRGQRAEGSWQMAAGSEQRAAKS